MTAKKRIYLDCNATMPVKPEVIDVVCDAMRETGNVSSVHGHGRAARKAVEDARASIAALAGTSPAYVFFTSGATEGNNTVIKSFRGQPVFVSAIEHPSVLESALGAQKIPVTKDGVIDLEKLELMLGAVQPALVSVMFVNNETGVIQPVADIVRMVRRLAPQARVHVDAVQASGRIPVDFSALQADYMSLSAHKCGGPQGVGALVMAPGARIEPLLQGGGQERRQRSGTENVAAIAGFGKAAELAVADMDAFQKLFSLRDRIEARLKAAEPRLKVFGQGAPRVANTTQLSLPGVSADTQLMALDLAGISVSSGSACSSGAAHNSHVLEAMGATPAEVMGALRVSLGWNTTENDVDAFIAAWLEMHARIKNRIAA